MDRTSLTRFMVGMMLFLVMVFSTPISKPPTSFQDTHQAIELTEGGSIAGTVCGFGIGVTLGAALLFSGGTAGLLVAILAPKAVAACIYYAAS